MAIEILNILATGLSILAAILLFRAGMMLGGRLKIAFNLIALGVFLSVTVHSIAELITVYGNYDVSTLLLIMPILVSIGALLLIIGGNSAVQSMREKYLCEVEEYVEQKSKKMKKKRKKK